MTVFQEYKKKQQMESVSERSPPKRDQLEMIRPREIKTRGGKTAGAKATNFKPPTGSWEEDILDIDACEESDRTVKVYLTWKGGQKTQHTLDQVYKRCPQMVRYNTKPPCTYTY